VDFDVVQSFGQEAGKAGWVMHPVITHPRASYTHPLARLLARCTILVSASAVIRSAPFDRTSALTMS
jgi:hypothetical protein